MITMDYREPSYSQSYITKDLIVDETDLVQMGQNNQQTLLNLNFQIPEQSYFITWPT